MSLVDTDRIDEIYSSRGSPAVAFASPVFVSDFDWRFNEELSCIGDFFSKIVPNLVQQMGGMFREIVNKEEEVKSILNEEELSFAKTLDRGEKQFEFYAEKSKKEGKTSLHGADVWRLYDTFGFPVDLTRLMAEERGLSIDDNEFETARLAAKEASKGEKKAGPVASGAKLLLEKL